MQSLKLWQVLLCLCLFVSCEKKETIVQDDGQEFCPVNFRYRKNFVNTSSCTGIPFNGEGPKISLEATGYQLSQFIFNEHTPYFSWIDSLDEYKAYHFFEKGRSVRFDFEKRDMYVGTRLVLFAGPTQNLSTNIYWESYDAVDSENHLVEVYIERISEFTYLLNSKVNGVAQSLGVEIPDFDRGSFEIIINTDGVATLKIGYAKGTDSESFETKIDQNEIQELIDKRPFFGIGFYVDEPSCIVKIISIKPLTYEYKNELDPSKNVTDNFNCNSIWIK
jgi:hypothetical protein